MLNTRRLWILRELAQRGTIAATAEALGYSAPAVSQHLAALERECGMRLLERDGRGRRLTDGAQALVARSEAVFAAMEAAEAVIANSRHRASGTLRCAAFPSALRALVVPAVTLLAQRHPELHVLTHEREPDLSVPALKGRELDVAIVQDYAFAPLTPDAGVVRHPLLDDPVKLAAADARIPDGPVDLAALAEHDWIAGRDGTWCHAVVLHAARTAGFEPRIAHRTNHWPIVYALVAAGAGVALVPGLAGPPPPGVRLVSIQGPSLMRRIAAATRSGAADHPTTRAMLDALTDAGHSASAPPERAITA
jgi:DNA-binding transcriptional LysR family regulator